MGIEFELKYRATPAQQAALLERFGGQGRAISMETTYYDTPDRYLSARHITLRRRMENNVSVCTVKTCGARFTRQAIDIHTPEFSAELAIDSGVLLGGGKEEPLCEVELELKSGNANAMIAYMTELATQFGLVTEPHSKFRRAKRLAEGV